MLAKERASVLETIRSGVARSWHQLVPCWIAVFVLTQWTLTFGGLAKGPGINDNGSGSAAILQMALNTLSGRKDHRNKIVFAWCVMLQSD